MEEEHEYFTPWSPVMQLSVPPATAVSDGPQPEDGM